MDTIFVFLNINKLCITLSLLSSSSGFFTIFFKGLCKDIMDLQPSWKRENFLNFLNLVRCRTYLNLESNTCLLVGELVYDSEIFKNLLFRAAFEVFIDVETNFLKSP